MDDRLYKILEFNQIREQLAAMTSSELSRQLAEELTPSTDAAEIQRMLQESDDAVALVMKKGRPPLGGIVNVIPSVKRAAGGSMLGFPELLAVAGVLRAARRTLNYCREGKDGNGEAENLVAEMISRLIEDYALESDITRCIVSEDEMADDASPELADIRRKIVKEQNNIRERLNDFIHSAKYQKAIQDAVITMRGDRYCIPVKAEYRGEFPGMVHDMSGSGQTLFIEPAVIVDSNNKIRELRVREKQEVERITLMLGSLVAEKQGVIIQDVKLLTSVDFAFAKAALALKLKAKRPSVNENGYIKIVKGRHPLIDPHKVVPTSLYIGKDFRTLVITGPNTGGKTVTLKTVGLFTLMMQSGLLVPCETTSELAIFDHIFADIGDEQSIAQSLSTFSAHMSNIVRIINGTTDKTLVLLDELGAGTDPTEGAALAMAILECLYQMGATTFATTHYSELKAFTVSTEGFENACCEFDVETLSPTYRLMIGIPGKSNAFAISTKLGLDAAVVDRAKEFLSVEDIRFEDLLSDIEKKRGEIEQKEAEIRMLTEEAERRKREADEEKEKLAAQKAELMKKAREEAAQVVSDAKKNVDGLLAELRTLCRDSEADNKERLKAGEALGRDYAKTRDDAEISRYLAGKKNSDKMEKVEGELLPGQTVYSVSLDVNVTVLKVDKRDGKVTVQAGIMKMVLPESDLRAVENQPGVPEKKGNNGSSAKGVATELRGLSFKPELDLRGLTAQEALSVTDRYLDQAQQCRMETVTVIHGKGTGVLRREIHNMLKKDRRVSEFRLGEFGEGDYGVTIVKLKV